MPLLLIKRGANYIPQYRIHVRVVSGDFVDRFGNHGWLFVVVRVTSWIVFAPETAGIHEITRSDTKKVREPASPAHQPALLAVAFWGP